MPRSLNCKSVYLLAAMGIWFHLGLITPNVVNATTILRVDMEFLLATAKLVFEGEVVAHRAQWNTQRTSIFTAVTFRVDDVIKGDYPGEFVTFNYAGGVVGDEGMQVSAMVYPKIGERGIYFIENLDQELINPMVGWGQGHYVLHSDRDGKQRLLTESYHPILRMEPDRDASAEQRSQSARRGNQIAPPTSSNDESFSDGIAYGLKTAGPNTDLSAAMDKQAFKQALREKLTRMREAGER